MTRRALLVSALGVALCAHAACSARVGAAVSNPLVARCWDVLHKGLKNGDPDKRKMAVTAVASIGARPEVLNIVHGALHDKSAIVRQTAAAVLGQIKSTASIPYLKEALGDDSEVAFTAAKSLWEIGDKSGREVFEEILRGERSDAPGMVRSAMRDARRKLRNPAQLALMGVREASGAFLGPASMGVLLAEDALKDSGAPGRAVAASYLAADPDPYALTLLEWGLADKSWGVRLAVAKALGRRGNRAATGKLEPLLDDDKEAVREMAAASIIRLSSRGNRGQPGTPHRAASGRSQQQPASALPLDPAAYR
jgi:HEAT repeat protein